MQSQRKVRDRLTDLLESRVTTRDDATIIYHLLEQSKSNKNGWYYEG